MARSVALIGVDARDFGIKLTAAEPDAQLLAGAHLPGVLYYLLVVEDDGVATFERGKRAYRV